MLALALVLPFLTGQLPQIGNMLCPMHLPVLLCGFLLGWPWGLAVGVTAPLLRSALFGMPPLYPVALAMCLELGCYGLVIGLASTPGCATPLLATTLCWRPPWSPGGWYGVPPAL